MARFTFTAPNGNEFRTDCPEIGLTCFGRNIDATDMPRLRTALQPFLDTQQALRALLEKGGSVLDGSEEAGRIRAQIMKHASLAGHIVLGAWTLNIAKR